eukprot:2207669-Prymnesium_polylepis.1
MGGQAARRSFNFCVQFVESASHTWYADLLSRALDAKPEDGSLSAIAAKVHDLTLAEGRAEFWEVLRKLTSEKKRGK